VGEPAALERGFRALQTRLATVGLSLVPAKCVLLMHADQAATQAALAQKLGIKQADNRRMPLLGSIVGETVEDEEGWVTDTANTLIDKFIDPIATLINNSHSVGGPTLQSIFHVLRLCAVPRFTHVLRTTPPRAAYQGCLRIDKAVWSALTGLFQLTENQSGGNWDLTLALMHTPISLGGIGIPSAFDTRGAAYIGSMILAAPLIAKCVPDIAELVPRTASPVPMPHTGLQWFNRAVVDACAEGLFEPDDFSLAGAVMAPDAKRAGYQAKIAGAQAALRYKKLYAIQPGQWQTLMRSSGTTYAGSFLHALPGAYWSNMRNDTFRHAVCYRLLAPLIALPAGEAFGSRRCPHPECNAHLDPLFHHALACNKLRAYHIYRHDNICRVWITIARRGGYFVKREPKVAPGYFNVREGARCASYKGDVGFYETDALAKVLDVSVAFTRPPMLTPPPAVTPEPVGYFAAMRESSKESHYRLGTDMPVTTLVVGAVETLGTVGAQAVEFVRLLTQDGCTGGDEKEREKEYARMIAYNFTQLSFALQTGNGMQIGQFADKYREWHRSTRAAGPGVAEGGVGAGAGVA
jgi:hypothetical protein